jgi:hypothetical protein
MKTGHGKEQETNVKMKGRKISYDNKRYSKEVGGIKLE